MARWGSGVIGNSSRGSNIQGAAQGIYAESSVQMAPIGTLRELEDGRRFRYGQAAGTIPAGRLVAQDFSLSAVTENNDIATAAAVGATEVILTDATDLGSATKDQYEGGYLHISDDGGEGHTYRIKGNSAASSNAVTFTLYDGLVVALTTTSDTAITGNPWKELVSATAAGDMVVSGVSMVAVTDNYYAWFQTSGVATVLADGTCNVGDLLTLSDGVAGAVQTMDQGTGHEAVAGSCLFTNNETDDTPHVGILLNLF